MTTATGADEAIGRAAPAEFIIRFYTGFDSTDSRTLGLQRNKRP